MTQGKYSQEDYCLAWCPPPTPLAVFKTFTEPGFLQSATQKAVSLVLPRRAVTEIQLLRWNKERLRLLGTGFPRLFEMVMNESASLAPFCRSPFKSLDAGPALNKMKGSSAGAFTEQRTDGPTD